MYVNLLPRPLLWRLLVRIRLRQWGMAWGTVAAAVLAIGGWEYFDLAAKRKQRHAAELRCESLRTVEAETDALRQRLAVVEKKSAALAALAPEDRVITLLGLVAKCAKQTDEKVQLQRFAFQAAAEAPPNGAPSTPEAEAPAAAAPAALSLLQLQGTALDDRAVAQFVEALKQASIFERVELKSSNHMQMEGRSARQFQIECRF